MTLNHIISLAFVVFFIRFVCFAFELPNNFEIMWRPGRFESLPLLVFWVLVIVFTSTIIFFIRKLKNTDDKIKNSFFIYFSIIFVFLSFFSKTINDTKITYLLLLFNSQSPFSDIYPNLILDSLYDMPYIAWSMLFMILIYVFFKKYHHIEYSIPFWIIPFSFIGFYKNDFTIIVALSFCILAIFGMKYSKKQSSFFILLIQFVINLSSVFYVNKNFYPHPNYLIITIITLLCFYIPSFVLLWYMLKGKNANENTNALTWVIPGLTLCFLFLPLSKLTTSDNLIYYISMLNSFLFLGNLSLIVTFVSLIVITIDKLIKGSGKYILYISSTIVIVYYVLDATLFYYSQFRINYQTIAWTKTMNDAVNTTFATYLTYLPFRSTILVLLVILLSVVLLFKAKQIIKTIPDIKFNLLIILLLSQTTVTLLQLSNSIPQILRDPFIEMIKSIPISNLFTNPLSLEEIKKGFSECKLPLKMYSKKNVNNNITKTNVILITLESVHWQYVKMFGNENITWPLMGKFNERMIIFPYMFSCFPESICGDYAMNSSIIPYNNLYFSNNPDVLHKTIVNELKNNGYETLLFASSSLNDSNRISLVKTMPFDYKFSFSSSDEGDINDRLIWGYKEEYTTQKILEKLESRDSHKPFFIWYRNVYPHAPYELYDSQEKPTFNELDGYGKQTLLSRYKNSLVHLDKVFYNFINKITELDRKNNQKTLIVMVGDHGEMLGEQYNFGITGHGLFTTPQLQNVVCIFIKPENTGLEINQNIGSQIDILPTILDYLKLEPSVDRYEQGKSLYSTDLASRPIYLSSVESYAVIEDGYFFEFHDKNSPNFKITKLSYSNEDYMPRYEYIPNWPNHNEIFEKYQRVKKFYKLQEEFMNNHL